jgi:hypothetical protein
MDAAWPVGTASRERTVVGLEGTYGDGNGTGTRARGGLKFKFDRGRGRERSRVAGIAGIFMKY